MRPYLTVIVTTYNREKQLAKCLDKLKNQTLTADAYEIIVVNDGSTDNTQKFLNEQSGITVFHQENAGQGNARNLAIPHAQGQVILFIGDDIYAPESFLETHVNFHKENPNLEDACLGLTLWDQDLKQNPFMQWLTDGGPQFAYHKLEPNQEASFWFFYTSNISLKAELLHRQPFDPDFKGYGWEDIELAYRMSKDEGLRITYTPAALAYHDHYMEENSLKNRMSQVGRSANIFQMKHPELKVIPKGLKRIILHLIASWPSLFLISLLRLLVPSSGRRLYWYALSKRYFLQGLNHH